MWSQIRCKAVNTKKCLQKCEPTTTRKGVSAMFSSFILLIGSLASIALWINKILTLFEPRVVYLVLKETESVDLSRIANWYLLAAVVVAGVAFIAAMWAFIFKMLKN
jgi:hypothetical protein